MIYSELSQMNTIYLSHSTQELREPFSGNKRYSNGQHLDKELKKIKVESIPTIPQIPGLFSNNFKINISLQ